MILISSSQDKVKTKTKYKIQRCLLQLNRTEMFIFSLYCLSWGLSPGLRNSETDLTDWTWSGDVTRQDWSSPVRINYTLTCSIARPHSALFLHQLLGAGILRTPCIIFWKFCIWDIPSIVPTVFIVLFVVDLISDVW